MEFKHTEDKEWFYGMKKELLITILNSFVEFLHRDERQKRKRNVKQIILRLASASVSIIWQWGFIERKWQLRWIHVNPLKSEIISSLLLTIPIAL